MSSLCSASRTVAAPLAPASSDRVMKSLVLASANASLYQM
jgi:hypothetical protein